MLARIMKKSIGIRAFSTGTKKFINGIPWNMNNAPALQSIPDKQFVAEYLKSKVLPDSYLIDQFDKHQQLFLSALSTQNEKAVKELCESQFASRIIKAFRTSKEPLGVLFNNT